MVIILAAMILTILPLMADGIGIISRSTLFTMQWQKGLSSSSSRGMEICLSMEYISILI